MLIFAILGGLVAGGLLMWLYCRALGAQSLSRVNELSASNAKLEARVTELQATVEDFSNQNVGLSTSLSERQAAFDRELMILREAGETLKAERESIETRFAEVRSQFEQAKADKAVLQNQLIEQVQRFEAEARTLREGFEEQKRLLIDEVEPRWRGFFKTESREALSDNRKDFIRDAEAQIKPLGETLRKLEEQVGHLGKSEASLQEQLRQLQTGTTDLIHAIRGKPQLRGNWGELVLKDIVEFVGMVDRCHFFEQQTLDDRRRPDMIIRLPQDRQVAVDSKHVVEAFWPVAEAAQAGDAGVYLEARKVFAGKVRKQIDELSRKEYWKNIGGNVDFVVMFLPAEAHYREAIDADSSLMEYAARNNVLLLSPLTLLALLRMMATTWREQGQIEFAREMIDEAKRFYERVERFHARLGATGKALDTAVARFDDAVTAWDGNQGVMRIAERVGKLGAGDGKPVPEIPQLERRTRALESAVSIEVEAAAIELAEDELFPSGAIA